MRKIAITITLIIGVIFAFSSCAHVGGDNWVGAWASASQTDIDAFKKEIKGLYAGMSETQWDAFITAVEEASGVTGLPRGNPDNWSDAQWARLYNALKTYEASEAAAGVKWDSWLLGLRASIMGISTSGAAGGTAGSGTAVSATPPARYAAGTPNFNYWNMYSRYSSNLDLTGAQQHTVVSGDTLNQIANRYYNDAHYYPVILLANRDQIVDPDEIVTGMVLTIPDLQRNLANPAARQDIKNVITEVSEMRRTEGATDAANNLRNLANSL